MAESQCSQSSAPQAAECRHESRSHQRGSRATQRGECSRRRQLALPLTVEPMSARRPRSSAGDRGRLAAVSRRGDRAADCAALEMLCLRKGTGGSNPPLSACTPSRHRNSMTACLLWGRHELLKGVWSKTRPWLKRLPRFALAMLSGWEFRPQPSTLSVPNSTARPVAAEIRHSIKSQLQRLSWFLTRLFFFDHTPSRSTCCNRHSAINQLILVMTLWCTVLTEVVVTSIKADNSLARRFVITVGRNSLFS